MAAKKKNNGSLISSSVSAQKVAESEVEAYAYVRDRLRDQGWSVKNPSLQTGGQVWTQNQCLMHADMKRAFGSKRPEYVIKLTEGFVWIIETKSTRKEIDLAVHEACNFYAAELNKSGGNLRAILASGIAGNTASGYLVKHYILIEDRWQQVTINGQPATGLLSAADVGILLNSTEPDIHEFAPPQRLFLQAAERINAILHVGGINKNDRAKTIAALLLSVIDQPPNVDTSLRVLVGEINARSEAVLKENDKPDFAPFVKILPPTNTTNHVKFKHALVSTIQELQDLNIRSAMNSNTDVLGQFYEVFLKYGNGAKEIGIVLTPRHITRFAVDALGISPQDIVLDPACGTGGFLVAAFDYVRRTSSQQQLEVFKKHNLFGIEQESYIAALAIVNMIFRGDGKNNITEGNCFTTHVKRQTVDGYPSAAFATKQPEPNEQAVTRVLMNPPFALSNSQEKEYEFVSHALSQMSDSGILFSLLPMDVMFGAHEEKLWRENDLLANHTLIADISLPDEVFYPAALKQVLGIIVKKGTPHPKSQPVFWARIDRDGHIKLKSKRLIASDLIPPRSEADEIPMILPSLRNFVVNPLGTQVNIPMLCKTAPIDFTDPLLELLPEAYLDSPILTPEEVDRGVDSLLRETASFLIRFKHEDYAERFDAED